VAGSSRLRPPTINCRHRSRACLSSMSEPEPTDGPGETSSSVGAHLGSWVLAGVGVVAALVAVTLDRAGAQSAASQVWSPFVLVAGLLLVGLVADQDGLFGAAGYRLAVLAPNGVVLFAGAAATVAVVTALLNLDTSVVFLTPVLVYAARSRGQGEVPLLIGCILLSNGASLLLPGSNLTNLIVIGHLHLSGSQFFARMALPWVASILLTAVVIVVAESRSLRTGSATPERPEPERPEPVRIGLGALAVVAVTVLVLVLRSPALPVAGVGLLVVVVRLAARRTAVDRVRNVLGIPVLIGLFGIATALGTLGRAWSGPANLLAHLDPVGTAVVAAGAAVLVNNLPAASLLAARVPPHPFALLVGLNVGPNLFVTGSLAWILWWRTARLSGSNPPVARAIALGLVTVPMAMAAALVMLAVTGSL
jgi:arsenical pump membrane protein